MRLLRVIIVLFSVFTGSSSKSIFVQPTFRPSCLQGFVPDSYGICVEVIENNGYDIFILGKLNSASSFDYYEDDSEPKPPQSDEQNSENDYNTNFQSGDDDIINVPPSAFDENLGQDFLEEEESNLSNEYRSVKAKTKRSTPRLIDLTEGSNSSEHNENEGTESPVSTTNEISDVIKPKTENSHVLNRLFLGSEDLQVNNKTKSVIKNTSINKSSITLTNLLAESSSIISNILSTNPQKIVKTGDNGDIVNIDSIENFNSAYKKYVNTYFLVKRRPENANRGIPFKTFIITFFNSNNKTDNPDSSNVIEKNTKGRRTTKIRHRKFNFIGVLKKILKDRKLIS